MAIHPFQIGELNFNFLQNSPASTTAGTFASEFGSVADNINAQTARYMKMAAVWADTNIGAVSTGPTADSFGQGTGSNDNNSQSFPWRPNGSYYVRGLYFTNTAIPPNPSGYRVGYIGTFVSGLLSLDYGHDPNAGPAGGIDYEAVYSHGTATWPMTADIAHQWLDTTSNPADGTDAITNSSSALSRSVYTAPAYQILHVTSTGSNNLSSGLVSFLVETRPSLRLCGFNDGNGQSQFNSSFTSACTPNSNGVGTAYNSDPSRNNSALSTVASNLFLEYYQVSGVRKLNSRGLSLHLAKVLDNGWPAFSYPWEEDGVTPGTGITVSTNSISPTWPAHVNSQQQYVWAGGRDKGAGITSVSVNGSNVVTVTCVNTFSPGQIVIIQGLVSAAFLNGALLTIATASGSQFTANFTHGTYGPTAETQGTATFNPDFRVRNTATFIINEEYYGLVMDTKCTIWSNKTSMIPMLFVDLADIWTGSTAKRIAGVAVVPTYINATKVLSYQVFFLSEDGELARYDFTQTNGVLELAGSGSFSGGTNAPAVLAAGESYGALRARSTTSTITNIDITTNVLTVSCVNTFEVGEVVNLTGLTTATYLNGQTVQVASASGTQFTANYTHANDPSHVDTGSAVGYSLWVLYGTMTADPRSTQTGLANTANINLYRYLIGTGVWGSIHTSPNTGRHNGRSLNEMIVARDGRLYMIIEDVTSTGGGPWTVANASGVVTNVNWQVQAYDPVANTWNTSKINGTTLIQYGANMGGTGTSPSATTDFWFYNINAFLIDIGTGKLLIQPNWTIGALQVLDVSGTTAALANANLSTTGLSAGSLVSGNSGTDPFTIVHARDFATTGERTVFFQHDLVRQNSGTVPLYLAPPSYNWGSPTALTQIPRNSYSGQTIQTFDKDKWSYSTLDTLEGSFSDHAAWTWPTNLTDNQIHFVRGSGGNTDGLPSAVYGRAFGQSIGFLPTYWKWTGSAWTMADSWADAFASPKTVSNAGVDQPLPYGLKVQFGPLGSTSYSLGEFHTWNMCYGNTKFARKLRSSWAQFAGQTFVYTDTRSMASQEAMSINLIDTDLGSVTTTAPTSSTPHTAALTANPQGWLTQTTWPKLDPSNAGHDATPFVIVWQPSNFQVGSNGYAPVNNETGSGPGPYSWTVNAVTYAAQGSTDQTNFEAWRAFSGTFGDFWRSSAQASTLAVDLGSAKTINSYGFRVIFNSTNVLDGGVPKTWTLEGSNGSLTSGFSTIDTRSNIVPTVRSIAFNVTTPASYRYYRLNVTATQSGAAAEVGQFKLNTAVLQTTVNFTEIAFYGYGAQDSAAFHYPFVRNSQMARGLKFEVSTNGGGSYTPITPIWRAHMGYIWTFARQTGVTNIRITVQHGHNYSTSTNSTNQQATSAFGPFYLIDYGVSQGTLDAARLGSSVASDGTAPRGSFDTNALGIAVDVANISIDGANPSLIAPYSTLENGAIHGFYDFSPVLDAAHAPGSIAQYKMHPFYGFMLFEGAGADGALSFKSGTTAVINYQWGRRI